MAKKTSIKVRLVPEQKQNSSFYYYVKKPTAGEKAKNKLKLKKYNPNTRKHEFFIEKKLRNYLIISLSILLKFLNLKCLFNSVSILVKNLFVPKVCVADFE